MEAHIKNIAWVRNQALVDFKVCKSVMRNVIAKSCMGREWGLEEFDVTVGNVF